MVSSLSDTSPTPHLDALRAHWAELVAFRSGALVPLIDGDSFSLAAIVAVSRFRVVPQLDESPRVLQRVRASSDFASAFVATSQDANASMYGVTTGFGGSGEILLHCCTVLSVPTSSLAANTRVKEAPKLQQVLIKCLQSGIIPPPWQSPCAAPNQENKPLPEHPALSVESLIMPESWTRGAISVRLNSLIRGHSGCRFTVLRALHALLVNNITPCPPLRMSISASGDLGPLAYIASAVIGGDNCLVWSGEGTARVRIPASKALAQHGLTPLTFHPKEGLAIVNGTAPSCSTAASVLHDAHFVLLLSQACTALCVEALMGTREGFTPFLHDVARAHPGQVEVAKNLRRALAGSSLATATYDERNPEQRLRQDRYCLRTAPQWIGPQIEDALAAHRTLALEINSTTDNPIIDASPGGAGPLCGGNFQGTSVTLAMEKVRIGLQHVGRIAYAQIVELGQPSMNRGLAPDLAASEPSLDYGQKALDIAAASYLGELSFVANTVSNHVQPAEMHNQSVNSLALVSARYTATAVQLTQMILANELLSLCQAADLRAMYRLFFQGLRTLIHDALAVHISPPLPQAQHEALTALLFSQARVSFGETSTLDTDARFPALVRPLLADVFTYLSGTSLAHTHAFDAPCFHDKLARDAASLWLANRAAYFAGEKGDAVALLGHTRALYKWVRGTLGVPMRRGIEVDTEATDVQVSRVYEGIVNGDVNSVLLSVLGGEEV